MAERIQRSKESEKVENNKERVQEVKGDIKTEKLAVGTGFRVEEVSTGMSAGRNAEINGNQGFNFPIIEETKEQRNHPTQVHRRHSSLFHHIITSAEQFWNTSQVQAKPTQNTSQSILNPSVHPKTAKDNNISD
eukprot:TRINITY_DN6865_c0_g1_i3.p1 TRINITY_DN6865_c0_g1~~TRINITY_DN6865_c0_g1_i3.p1  ORF type:complete len:134 (+),score=14.27 TRINITY_DN6865_c0_g1_i3:110-511(+)